MKKQTKILAMLLCLAMLLPACAKDEPADDKTPTSDSPKQETPAPAEGETEPDPESAEAETERKPVPQTTLQEFGNKDFKVVCRGASTYRLTDVYADEILGELINDIVYERNTGLEDQMKFHFVFNIQPDAAGFVEKDVEAGTGEVDVVVDSVNSLFRIGADNALYNWRTLPNVDGTTPWWDAKSFEMSIANRLYVVNNDISTSTTANARFLYFNKEIHQVNNLKNPYEMVDQGTWTWDEFETMVNAVSEDLDGNGTMDGHDRYGLLYEVPSFFWTGCEVLLTTKDENDIPVINCVSERSVDILARIRELEKNAKNVISYDNVARGQDTSGFAHVWNFGRSLFAGGQFLFVQNGAGVASQFTEMQDPYGILPNPKYDETQTEYYHLIDPYACAWAISSQVKDIHMVETIMDHWAYNSAELIDAFYETTMKGRRLDAPDDARMLDLIRTTIRYEIAEAYDIGISKFVQSAYTSGNMMSAYKSQGRMIEKQLGRLVDKFGSDGEAK